MRSITILIISFFLLSACFVHKGEVSYFHGYHGKNPIKKPKPKTETTSEQWRGRELYDDYDFYADQWRLHSRFHSADPWDNYRWNYRPYRHHRPYYYSDFWWMFDDNYWDYWWYSDNYWEYQFSYYWGHSPYDYYYWDSYYYPQIIIIYNRDYYYDSSTSTESEKNRRRPFRRRSSSHHDDDENPYLNPQTTTTVPVLTPTTSDTKIPTISAPNSGDTNSNSNSTKSDESKSDKKEKKKRTKKRRHS